MKRMVTAHEAHNEPRATRSTVRASCAAGAPQPPENQPCPFARCALTPSSCARQAARKLAQSAAPSAIRWRTVYQFTSLDATTQANVKNTILPTVLKIVDKFLQVRPWGAARRQGSPAAPPRACVQAPPPAAPPARQGCARSAAQLLSALAAWLPRPLQIKQPESSNLLVSSIWTNTANKCLFSSVEQDIVTGGQQVDVHGVSACRPRRKACRRHGAAQQRTWRGAAAARWAAPSGQRPAAPGVLLQRRSCGQPAGPHLPHPPGALLQTVEGLA
jgi:hypothetical protein